MVRIVFFGSSDYAVPFLRTCLDLPDAEVVAVVTQPDRVRGGSGEPRAVPVRELAAAADVPVVLEPQQLGRDTTEVLGDLSPDIGVMAAFGHILPDHLLTLFPHGVLNVHASLLPRHRGPSPVTTAIALGDEESGATIVKVGRALDTGPILGQVRTPIGPLDTTGMLAGRIAELGANLLARLLPHWVAGDITVEEQEEGAATYTQPRSRDSGAIDWSRSAITIGRQVRAHQPWPLAATKHRDERFVIHEAWPLPEFSAQAWEGWVVEGDGADLGKLLAGRVARAVVVCGSGGLALLRVQRAGSGAEDIEVYLNGDPELIGSRLGDGFIDRDRRDRGWREHLDNRRSRHASGVGDRPRHWRLRPEKHERHLKECIVFRRHCPAYWYSGPFGGPHTPDRSNAYYVVRWNRPYYPNNYFEI